MIRQIRSLGSLGKKTGEQADFIIGSLRLLQDTHLIFRGSNFSPKRQGGLLLLIVSLIKGFIRSESIQWIKTKAMERYAKRKVCYNNLSSYKKDISQRSQREGLPILLEPLTS